jgi:hypothetical protein
MKVYWYVIKYKGQNKFYNGVKPSLNKEVVKDKAKSLNLSPKIFCVYKISDKTLTDIYDWYTHTFKNDTTDSNDTNDTNDTNDSNEKILYLVYDNQFDRDKPRCRDLSPNIILTTFDYTEVINKIFEYNQMYLSCDYLDYVEVIKKGEHDFEYNNTYMYGLVGYLVIKLGKERE